jgi:hypothetical protein
MHLPLLCAAPCHDLHCRWVVPDALISFVLKVFAPLVLKSVLKVLKRMFHSSSNGAAASADGTACSGSALTQRLASRPEYAAIGAHARRYLAAKAAAPAGNGTVARVQSGAAAATML